MIPVVTMNNKGEVIGQQALNDNLTVVEQINRSMLATLVCAQQKLTNDKNKLDRIIMAGDYNAEKLESIKEAVFALNKAMTTAVATFEEAIAE